MARRAVRCGDTPIAGFANGLRVQAKLSTQSDSFEESHRCFLADRTRPSPCLLLVRPRSRQLPSTHRPRPPEPSQVLSKTPQAQQSVGRVFLFTMTEPTRRPR